MQNPFYDAGWAARLRVADAALLAAQQNEQAAARAGFAGAAHRAALAALEAAQAHRRAAFVAQFARVADYAAWRFGRLEAAKDGFAIVWEELDYPSIAAVDEAFERALRHRREGTLEQDFRLNIGQPAGLAAFADASRLLSTWRRFGAIDCMVSFDAVDDEFHVCLAHHWGKLTRDSNESFRRIATQLARESIALIHPEAGPIFAAERHRLAQHRDLIRQVNALAGKFRFYRHLLPEHGLREEFCAVSMGWDGARFIDPEWSSVVYGTLPGALREAAGQPALPALPGAFTPG